MKFSTPAAIMAMAGVAAAVKNERTFAVLRFTNKGLVQARVDPIVDTGKPSAHAHNVLGGSNFGMSSTGESLKNSKCTNALVKGDNSNYWYPMLYFQDPKTGEFESVEVFYSNAYYFFEATNDDIKAFPTGLQLLVGDKTLRTPPSSGSITNLDPSKGPIQPVKFTCPRSNYDNPPSWPLDSNGTMAGMRDPVNKGEGVGFPDVDCDGYASPLRFDVHFPSCINVAAGLTNYKQNAVYPSDAGNGKADCPKGYMHVPHLFLEVYFNTPLFKDRWEQNKGIQPFVFSNGDATGYSGHADFMAAWDEPLLQHIIDTCNAGSSGMDKCPGLFYGLNNEDCTIPSPINEQVTGKLKALPGNNPVTGWGHGGNVSPPQNPGSSSSSAASTSKTSAAAQQPSGAPTSSKAGSSPSKPPTAPTSVNGYPVPSSSAGGNPGKPSSQPAAGSQTIKANPTNANSAASTALPTQNNPSQCTPKTQTVYETVTVTAGGPAAPTGVPSKDNSTASVAGFKSVGCFRDNIGRVLRGEILPNLGPMSNEKCINHCKAGGFALAATEYGGQCYCGNELVGSSKLEDSECSIKCEGDAKEICGGSWALSVYSKDGEASMKSANGRRAAAEHVHKHRSHRF